MMPRTGGRILVDHLVRQGVEHVFCVPGESYLAVLDALHDAALAVTVCRHEGAAAMAAEAMGKLTGRPGIAMVTRGPGATNAAHGLHIARHDETPMILFVGQVERGMRGREAFQELDYPAAFGALAKGVVEVDDAQRLPEILHRAFHVAMAGRPGPVVVALPEDVLTAMASVPDAPFAAATETHPALAQMAALQKRLWAATAPFVILGGSRWTARAVAAMTRFAERLALPVATAFRRQMLFPADHPCFAGHLGLGPDPAFLDAIRDSDLLLVIGDRLSEVPSQGYTLLPVPGDGARLIHVLPEAEELGRVYATGLAIHATPTAFAAAVEGVEPPAPIPWAARTAAIHAAARAWSDGAPPAPGSFDLGAVMLQLRERLPADAIITNGAGNYAIWVHRFHRFRRHGTQLAPTSGSMGYGLPAALAAKRLRPNTMVLCFAGDGCFLMTGQDFATAVHHNLPIIVIVIDNGMYGTIRMHQERAYPGRVSATTLTNPDFAAYARAFGGHGERVERTEDFLPAFERAVASGRPAILHCLVDPEAITPARSLTAIRTAARG